MYIDNTSPIAGQRSMPSYTNLGTATPAGSTCACISAVPNLLGNHSTGIPTLGLHRLAMGLDMPDRILTCFCIHDFQILGLILVAENILFLFGTSTACPDCTSDPLRETI